MVSEFKTIVNFLSVLPQFFFFKLGELYKSGVKFALA